MFHVGLYHAMRGSRVGPDVVVVFMFFSHQRIVERAVRTSLEKQLNPMGPNASREGSVLVFLRTIVATCDLSGGGGCPDPYTPLDTRTYADFSFSSWERADLLALLCVMFSCVFVTSPYGVWGQLWGLIVPISDICFLFYCYNTQRRDVI